MNSTNRPLNQYGAHDALFEQVERDLLALLTAPLAAPSTAPRECVDEFSNEFLGHWSMPPRRRTRGGW